MELTSEFPHQDIKEFNMARLWTTGAELNSLALEMGYLTPTGNAATSNTVARTGTYSIKMFPTAAPAAAAAFTKSVLASKSYLTLYARFYIYITTNPSAQISIYVTSDGTAAVGAKLYLNTDGSLTLKDGSNNVIGSSAIIPLSEWHLIEVKHQAISGVNNDVMELKLDGSSVCSTTTAAGAANGVSVIQFGSGANTINTVYYLDDIGINDNTGSFQNAWLGPGKVIYLRPNVAGDTNGWLKSDGSAGDANNYQAVDEITPDDGTTYNKSNTLGAEDLYKFTPSGISESDTINMVGVMVRFQETATQAAYFKMEIEEKASGTKEQSAEIQSLTVGVWVVNSPSNVPRAPTILLYDLPGVSTAPWTQRYLDTLQAGAIITAAKTEAVQISTIWVIVDYTPAAITSGYRSLLSVGK